eukprot:7526723-Lingulodinium_polyedra.AAC.1
MDPAPSTTKATAALLSTWSGSASQPSPLASGTSTGPTAVARRAAAGTANTRSWPWYATGTAKHD